MIGGVIVRVILDACVLYPAPVRDILLSFASEGLYQPKWTHHIQGEWIRNLLINRPDLTKERLELLAQTMDRAFPDANVIDYESRIDSLDLPDVDDRHVLAAALESDSDMIITFNLKDFPSKRLSEYGLLARHPDDFLIDLYNEDGLRGTQAFNKQLLRLKNPRVEAEDLLQILTKAGLPKIAKTLRNVR